MNKALLYDKQQHKIEERKSAAAHNPTYKADETETDSEDMKVESVDETKEQHRRENKCSVTEL